MPFGDKLHRERDMAWPEAAEIIADAERNGASVIAFVYITERDGKQYMQVMEQSIDADVCRDIATLFNMLADRKAV